MPDFPARPVRPMRCVYASNAASVSGRSNWMTCLMSEMSIPLATASVATRTSALPARNRASAASRWFCEQLPWICSQRTPWLRSSSLASHFAPCFLLTKTMVRSGVAARSGSSAASLSRFPPSPSHRTSRCSTEAFEAPTFPTATCAYRGRRYDRCATRCSAGGKVAENSSVCRCSRGGRSRCSTMRRSSGSNPMSSMRSASSSTRNSHLASESRGGERCSRSASRPGVATTISTPAARAAS
mmetsp:Transcript_79061/g.226070  ORF Transcript_79061/g.226070 Transcript_79061/m.226070 type:complete len:242 (-) Transcript_79061:94-819(-)